MDKNINLTYTMSLATFKRKTKEQYNNSSVGRPNFSINGTTRNQGWVGQTMLSRHFPMTPMKGNTAIGNGGLYGSYYQGNNIVSGINYLNDNHVIKPSVISTPGMLMTKYRWIRRPQPFMSVKTIDNINDEKSYISNLQKTTLYFIKDTTVKDIKTSSAVNVPTKNYNNIKKNCNIIKSSLNTQGDYLFRMHSLCAASNEKPSHYSASSGLPLTSMMGFKKKSPKC